MSNHPKLPGVVFRSAFLGRADFPAPFTITEYNYSGPGRFRGVGGILTGVLGALQGWSGIWRFAYSHNRESKVQPVRMDYFNMASDPLGQAAERAGMFLYLRGDMKQASHTVAILGSPSDASILSPMPQLPPDWHWMAWITPAFRRRWSRSRS